jgi:pimeloyl-ACP methyl ester carboxylesterase
MAAIGADLLLGFRVARTVRTSDSGGSRISPTRPGTRGRHGSAAPTVSDVDVEQLDVELQSTDGVQLAATTWRRTEADPLAAVVLVHGFASDRTHRTVTATASALLDAGFAVVACDVRGHGGSGGICTLGTDEALDVAAATSLAGELSPTVVAVGSSMGGLAVLRDAATAPDLAGLVSVSAPATWRVHSARSLFAAAMTRTAPGRLALRRAGVRVSPRWGAPTAPVEVAASVTCAAAIVHGAGDRFIPPREATRLFDRLGGPRRLDIVDGMDHGFGPLATSAIVDAVHWVIATTVVAGPGPDPWTAGHRPDRGAPTTRPGPPDPDLCAPPSPR